MESFGRKRVHNASEPCVMKRNRPHEEYEEDDMGKLVQHTMGKSTLQRAGGDVLEKTATRSRDDRSLAVAAIDTP